MKTLAWAAFGVVVLVLSACTASGPSPLDDAVFSLNVVENEEERDCVVRGIKNRTLLSERREQGLESSETAPFEIQRRFSEDASFRRSVASCIDAEKRLGARLAITGADPFDSGCVPDEQLTSGAIAELVLGEGPVLETEILRQFMEGCASDETLIALFTTSDPRDLKEDLFVHVWETPTGQPLSACASSGVIEVLGLTRLDALAERQQDLYGLTVNQLDISFDERIAIVAAMEACGDLGAFVTEAVAPLEPRLVDCAVSTLKAGDLLQLAEELALDERRSSIPIAANVPLQAALEDCAEGLLDAEFGPAQERPAVEQPVIDRFIVSEVRRLELNSFSVWERACAGRILDQGLTVEDVDLAQSDDRSQTHLLAVVRTVLPILEEAYRCGSTEAQWRGLLRSAEVGFATADSCLADATGQATLESFVRASAMASDISAEREAHLQALDDATAGVGLCLGSVQSEKFRSFYAFRAQQFADLRN